MKTAVMNTPKRLLAALALAALASCSSARPYAALPIEGDAERVANVVVTDSDLRDRLRVGRAGVSRVEASGQLKVVVPIRNVSSKALQLRVQTSFLDQERRPIGDETNHQVEVLSPGATVNFSVMSATRQARDWTMRLLPNTRS